MRMCRPGVVILTRLYADASNYFGRMPSGNHVLRFGTTACDGGRNDHCGVYRGNCGAGGCHRRHHGAFPGTGSATAASLSDRHFLLFPPLVVIAYEMFAHTEICPWAHRPLRLPLACALSAIAGLLLSRGYFPLPLAAAGSLLAGIYVLRTMRLHVPPAVSLLPFLMRGADWSFPLVVGVGTSLLSLSFLTWRRLDRRTGE